VSSNEGWTARDVTTIEDHQSHRFCLMCFTQHIHGGKLEFLSGCKKINQTSISRRPIRDVLMPLRKKATTVIW
jgi:hypothetical protein